MKRSLLITSLLLLGTVFSPSVIAEDLGEADFPADVEDPSPNSYHDAWCRKLKRECRVRFVGNAMRVDGFKGIKRKQLIGFRSDHDGQENYFYVKYLDSSNKPKNALFLFVHHAAAQEFSRALARWYEQDSKPYPNYRYPASQGPQNTYGRDRGLNPYGIDKRIDGMDKGSDFDDFRYILGFGRSIDEIGPNPLVTYASRGRAKAELGDYNGAISDYTRAIEKKGPDFHPDNLFLHKERGIAKAILGDYSGAIDDFTETIKIDPEYSVGYYLRGLAKKNTLLVPHQGSLKVFKAKYPKTGFKSACFDWRKASDLGDTEVRKNADLQIKDHCRN